MNGTNLSIDRKIDNGLDRRPSFATSFHIVYGLGNLFGLFAAGLLIYTGLIHLGNSYAFLASILRYQLAGFEISKHLAMILPVAHLVIGLCILCRLFLPASLVLASSLFSLYFIAQFSVMWRGLTISCGCFGLDSHQISWFSVGLVGSCSLLSWVSAAIFRKHR